MIRQKSAALAALKRLLIAEIFSDPWRHIGPSSAPRMATPFPRTVPQVIKIEDEGNHAPGAQELMDMFRNIAPPLPVHQPLPPPPPPPPPLPPHAPRAKRPATGPPPGFAGVRQPPQKPPCQRAPAQPHHAPQPAPNAHRAPGTPVPAPAHASQGPAAAALPLATNTAMAPLQRRSAPKPRHPAANKKPTVPCELCGVRCMTARHLKQHAQGRKHRSKAAYLAGEINVRCAVCNVHLSSALNVEQHYAGKQHLRRVNGGA